MNGVGDGDDGDDNGCWFPNSITRIFCCQMSKIWWCGMLKHWKWYIERFLFMCCAPFFATDWVCISVIFHPIILVVALFGFFFSLSFPVYILLRVSLVDHRCPARMRRPIQAWIGSQSSVRKPSTTSALEGKLKMDEICWLRWRCFTPHSPPPQATTCEKTVLYRRDRLSRRHQPPYLLC